MLRFIYSLFTFVASFVFSTLWGQTIDYQPDIDGDECITVIDLTSLLSQFGNCNNSVDSSSFVCGDFVSYNGFNYGTTQIGNQCWFTENLRTSTFNDGEPIEYIADDNLWNSGTPAYCYYLNLEVFASEYGYLYNGHTLTTTHEICPSGWHVPTETEFSELELFLGVPVSEIDDINWRGVDTDIADVLKSDSTDSPPWNGNNSTNFSAIPAGARNASFFNGVGELTRFWTNTYYNSADHWYRMLSSNNTGIYRRGMNRREAMSIRCIRDY